MGSSVSQINYWNDAIKIVNISTNKKGAADNKDNTDGSPGAVFLSYDVFMALSILGGFFALDHLYLRSPLTFLSKVIVNILCLGVWWIYDASHAVFNKDVVKVFGLGIPGVGPKGIAAGVLANDMPDKKHMSFFMYGLALLLGGIFGLDSFLVGDKQSGFIRLVCLITGILAPIAIFWWLYNLFIFLFKTKNVTSLYWEYFGSPPPAEHGMTIGEKLVTKFPFLQQIFGPISTVKNTVDNISEVLSHGPIKVVTDTISQLKPVINTVVTPVIQTALAPAIQAVMPLKQTLNTGLAVAQTGLATAKEGLALGKTALETGTAIASQTLDVVGQTADAATKALTLAPGAAALTSGLTTAVAQTALNNLSQSGGNQTAGNHAAGILPYVLIGTITIVAVSGLILTYRRSKQNAAQRKDDSPPEPGILRKSNKEKFIKTT